MTGPPGAPLELVTVSRLVGAATTLPFGALADRVGRTRLLAVSIPSNGGIGMRGWGGENGASFGVARSRGTERSHGMGLSDRGVPGSGRGEVALSEALATVSHRKSAGDRFGSVLPGLARAALLAIPGAASASLTAVDDDGVPFTPVATSESAREVDALQYRARLGPSLDAASASGWLAVTVRDLAEESRWPEFLEAAGQLKIRSILSVSLFASTAWESEDAQPSVGALTLYADQPEVFGEQERTTALLLALYASEALSAGDTINASSRRIDQLHDAMVTRNVIGQAQGILMERHKLTAGQAFDQLRAASQNLNLRLRDVAARLAETGAEPGVNDPPLPAGFAGAGEHSRLAAVRRYDILDTPPDGAFDRVAALAARVLHVPIAMVNIVDADRVWVKAAHGLPGLRQFGPEPGLCASVVTSESRYQVADAASDPRTSDHPLVAGLERIRFYAAAPIITADGYRLGTVAVLDREPRELTDEQMGILEELAAVVADKLEMRLAALDLYRHTRLRAGPTKTESDAGSS